MNHSNPSVSFQATHNWQDHTAHALLVCAFNKAQAVGFFNKIEKSLNLKMKKIHYSWADKLSTLWASIVVGCNHTSEINSKLGSHERASATLLGLERFPDQSQVNRLLWAFEPEHVNQWRQLHMDLLCRHTRATARKHWLQLSNRERVLAVDLDQRAVVVRGKQFELATKGYFGHKRARRGYQLSLAFIGGSVGEVLDEYFDSGNTQIAHRLDEILNSVEEFCRRTRIPPDCMLIRGDAQLGTALNIWKIKARGFHYLLKGMSASKAKKLASQVSDDAIFWSVDNGPQQRRAWMCDLGEVEHREGRNRSTGIRVKARTLLMVRYLRMSRSKRPDQKQRKRLEQEGRLVETETKVEYFLTDLTEEQLPVERVLETYNDRPTIERYFYDEQYSLGAKQVRTHHYAGAAMFQFLVATTNNLLRWMKHTTFKGTVIEKLGVGRLIHEAMQIPARIHKWGDRWRIEMPAQHYLVKQLINRWNEISLTEVET
jgi:Transposase DDE domain group 1